MKKTSLESFIPKKQKCMWTIAANFILNHFFLHIFEFENVKSRWHPKLQSEFLLEQQMLLEFISNSKWICLHNVCQKFTYRKAASLSKESAIHKMIDHVVNFNTRITQLGSKS